MYVGEAAAKLQQTSTFHELDLGLNHVVRKYSEPLEEHANLLISVPGGNDGPSGVIICSENYLTYKNLGDQVICKVVIGWNWNTVVSRFSVSRFNGLSRFSGLNAWDGAWSHHKFTISI